MACEKRKLANTYANSHANMRTHVHIYIYIIIISIICYTRKLIKLVLYNRRMTFSVRSQSRCVL